MKTYKKKWLEACDLLDRVGDVCKELTRQKAEMQKEIEMQAQIIRENHDTIISLEQELHGVYGKIAVARQALDRAKK